MVKYCDIFWSFFKIGFFTIGGGYAMIPLMQRELMERHRWMEEEHFMDAIAIAQSMPGVFAVNMATIVGYRLRGVAGAMAAIVGNIVMPIAMILAIAVFFRAVKDNVYVQRVFMGLRPAVVALIAAPVFNMIKSAGVTWKNCWIPIAATVAICLLNVSPVIVVLCAVAGGYLYSVKCNTGIR